MEGKVKNVSRVIGYKERTEDHGKSDVHPIRCTRTYAKTYDGKEVEIDENQIRAVTGCKRITTNTIKRLNDSMHNKRVKYDDRGNLLSDLMKLLFK